MEIFLFEILFKNLKNGVFVFLGFAYFFKKIIKKKLLYSQKNLTFLQKLFIINNFIYI